MYAFDAAADAQATLKERFVWMIFMGALFFILYGSANQYALLTAPHISLFMGWEMDLPFIPAFIVPYMSSDILFCMAFLLPYTRLELRVLAARVLFIILTSVILFVLIPIQYGFEKPEVSEFKFLFTLLKADLPYNQLPSLHISFAIVLWASMRTKISNIFLRSSLAVWLWLVALSTLLVYQHHFIDIPAGAVVGLVSLYLIPAGKLSYLTNRFTTPRHIKVGLYYLSGAVVLLLLAFWTEYMTIFFVWLFVSLLILSIVYAFGLNDWLAGHKGQANWLQWIIFGPYFIGSYFSWHYYRRSLPLFSHVKGHVYLGRMPTASEYEQIKSSGISQAFNLATEQQLQKSMIHQQRFPFLDLTIQSPESLLQIAKKIDELDGENIFIHCALGLSRSVLAVAAWLLYKGHTLEEVESLIGDHRVNYLRSAYMQVALKLYQTHLDQLVFSRAPQV
jgi:protein-tyrosine phosphatase